MAKRFSILTLSLCLLCLVANAQIVNIPDANFKNALVNSLCVDTNGDLSPDADADTDNDGEIQVSEALAVTSLYVKNRSIQSLIGITTFNELVFLDCENNQLTTLNMQGLTKLRTLYCSKNQLTSLDILGLINLNFLTCDNNQLVTLDVQETTSLRYLYCNNNQLTALDVQGLILLKALSCEHNQLTTLNVQGLANLTSINCSFNHLVTVEVQGLDNLESLYCTDNQLTVLDVGGLDKMRLLSCGNNQLTALNVQRLDNMQQLSCTNNQITALDLRRLGDLQLLDCGYNQLSTLNLQRQAKLEYLLCSNNHLIDLYIKNGSIEILMSFNNNPLSYICCDEGQLQSVQDQAALHGQTNCLVNTSCIQIVAHIQGSIRQDLNLNCLVDSTETGLAGRIIKAEKAGEKPFYSITNNTGDYDLVLDTGLYRLTLPNALSSNYYTLCTDSVWVSLPQIDDTVHTDFLLKPVVLCPLLEVNIASEGMRRCFENQYIVQYCNIGPVAAPNAQVTVTLSDDVTFIGSSIPGVHIGGQDWQFSLGEVASETCGSFSIHFLVICDSTVLGQSICATAHITPDSVCPPAGSPWSGAEVMVDGYCEGDSVHFVIRNIGTGDMTAAQEFVIVEDIVIFRTGTFNLAAQDSFAIKVPANGSAYRLEAEQEPTFPFPSQPSVTIEGCGLNLSGLFSLGFVSQFNDDDGNPFHSRDCRETVGSYDPNDKSAQPIGVATAHYIEPLNPIDYLIRFQNTGTDTAITVVIRDTLSPWLDIETFKTGISDHHFSVDFEGHNILKFTFDNILLPDSNVNEAASHGFVLFQITPKRGTPLGMRIENRAAIFFDFNAPIITNWVFHTVDTGFLDRKTIAVFSATAPAQQQIYPNPVRAGGRLFFEDLPEGKSHISLFSTLGKVVLEAELTGSMVHIPASLTNGLYFIEWRGEMGIKRWGKIKIEN